METDRKLQEVQLLFKVYEDELNTIMPNFTEELSNILQVKKDIINLENNRNPHYSEDFCKDMSRHSPKEEEMVEINLEECEIEEGSEKDCLQVKEENVVCKNCDEIHDLTLRMCKICNEQHEGCCEIIVT